jgi:hypothetical protein
VRCLRSQAATTAGPTRVNWIIFSTSTPRSATVLHGGATTR